MKEKSSRYYNFNVDDFKVEAGIIDVTKPKCFYMQFPLWVSVEGGDFNQAMKELDIKFKWWCRQCLYKHFEELGYIRSIIELDAPIESKNRIGSKNTYINLSINVFTKKDVDFDRVKIKGINQLVFTFAEDFIIFTTNIGDGYSFHPKKTS
jgi:hypothetical protein